MSVDPINLAEGFREYLKYLALRDAVSSLHQTMADANELLATLNKEDQR